MNQPWIHMCSPSRSLLPPPSPPDPSGSSQCTSPEHLSHASNLGCDLFHPWEYTYFNAILSEHPTLTFSHRVMHCIFKKDFSRASVSIAGRIFILSGYTMSLRTDTNNSLRKLNWELPFLIWTMNIISLSSVFVYSTTSSGPGVYRGLLICWMNY